MRLTIMLAIIISAVPLQAAPKHRILTAIPRGMGRSLKNMATFHDKEAAVEEWLAFGATMADAGSTVGVLDRCPGCQEINPLLGHRPSPGRTISIMVPIALLHTAQIQWAHEVCDGQKCYGAKQAPAILAIAGHTTAAVLNSEIK
jgi:hypothetical protein